MCRTFYTKAYARRVEGETSHTFIETPEEKASKRKKGKNLEEKRRERKKEKIP
jgi:hypothetical protein